MPCGQCGGVRAQVAIAILIIGWGTALKASEPSREGEDSGWVARATCNGHCTNMRGRRTGLRGSAVEAVREQATAAGESVGSAVTSAIDTVAERGRRARRKAQKNARKQSRSVRSTARDTVDSARRRSARRLRKAAEQAERRAAQLDAPKRRRSRLVATGVALAAAALAAAKFRGAKHEPPPGPPSV